MSRAVPAQAALPLSSLEAVLSVQDAAWLHRLAQGKDGEEVVPRTLPKSISCGKTFRGHNVLTGLTAVHEWLLQLGQELQERIEADRQQHQRLPKLLTVSFDSAPVEDQAAGHSGAAPAAAGAAGSSGGKGGSSSGSSSGAPQAGRMTAQNWRAGATNISRSCALRHARAEVIATDALGLVKKWARDRCGCWLAVAGLGPACWGNCCAGTLCTCGGDDLRAVCWSNQTAAPMEQWVRSAWLHAPTQ